MARELRWYQRDAVDAVYDQWKDGNTRTAIVLPTGAGKTDCIAEAATDGAREPGGRTLILAHRAELLDQITERCRMHDSTIPVGRVQAAAHQARRPITVAMAPTLAGAKRRARMLRPTRVIVDECHHAASPSYMRILEWAGCFDEVNPTPLMGVTATFTRGDKRGLGDVFQSVAYQQGTAWAIEEGYLIRPHGRVVVGEHMDLDHAKISKGDFVDSEVAEMFAQDVEQVVAAWFSYASDRITAAFTPNVESARALADAFRARGVPTGEVFGSTPHPERQRIYRDLASGRIRVLVNVMVATEGFDCPPISCVLMGRPTKLRGLYAQIVGRGLRLSEDTGKTDCLVLDVVGASRTQSLATLVDLIPSADYDTLEVDVIPCGDCGGFIGRRPEVIARAAEEGLDACACPCPGCGGWLSAGRAPAGWDGPGRCTCEDGGAAPDPDGGRRKLQGPARYAEIDLLGLADKESTGSRPYNWLATAGGVPFLASAGRFAALAPEGDTGMWSAAHVAGYGGKDAQLIAQHVALAHARRLAEKWADEYATELDKPLYLADAPWRRKNEEASEKQHALARKVGVEDPERFTKGGIADAVDVARASRQLDR